MHQHVVLVHEGEQLARPRLRAGERVADDPLDAVPRVEALLGRDLVRRAVAQDAAGADVRPLGALADDDHVDVAGLDPGERGGDAGKQPDRAQVDVVVELEPQPQQQAALEDAAGHRRVADRAEQDRVVPAQLVEHRVRQRLAGRVPASGAEVVLGRRRRRRRGRGDRTQHLEALGDHLGPDPVAADDGDPQGAAHACEGTAASRWSEPPSHDPSTSTRPALLHTPRRRTWGVLRRGAPPPGV